MKKILFLAFSVILLSFQQEAAAQRSYIRGKIRQDIEKKVADPHKEKGVKAVDDVTYENDTRFKNFKNTTPATLYFTVETLDKNGGVKKSTKEVYVFGSKGECIIMNQGAKDESHVIFNYVEKANYIVQVKDKSATKMPIISFKKKIEESNNQPLNQQNNWKITDEKKDISGYACRKYIYTYEDGKTADMWMTQSKVVNLNGHMLYASQFKSEAASKDPNIPKGFLVQSVLYNKKGVAEHRRTLTQAEAKANEVLFDMSNYKVNDVVDALR